MGKKVSRLLSDQRQIRTPHGIEHFTFRGGRQQSANQRETASPGNGATGRRGERNLLLAFSRFRLRCRFAG
jgi:hypothetical protein